MNLRARYQEIISREESRDAFREYLTKAFTEEHLDFRVVTDQVVLMKGPLTAVESIISEYVVVDSVKCINIPGRLRNGIISAYQEENDEVFERLRECVQAVDKMLWENFLVGFVEYYEQVGIQASLKNDITASSDEMKSIKTRKRSLSVCCVRLEPNEEEQKTHTPKKYHERIHLGKRKPMGEDRKPSPSVQVHHQKKHRNSLPLTPQSNHRRYEDFIQREIEKKESMIQRRNKIKLASASDNTHTHPEEM
eukprot:TRINITY_DN1122_c0_g2_i1.p1 TRINITY_DN1122_c0_g2~~TRINITY_DN1122_c0_g2_i1.p1  ORF type:complete len:251 (-),score=56.88 TRINITY_DN1122_c0_g2_i1:33-785(-)